MWMWNSLLSAKILHVIGTMEQQLKMENLSLKTNGVKKDKKQYYRREINK